MCAAWVSSSVRLPDFTRATTFRWTLVVAGAFGLCTLVLFGFVYWQTAAYMVSEYDALLSEEIRVFAANTPDQRHGGSDRRRRPRDAASAARRPSTAKWRSSCDRSEHRRARRACGNCSAGPRAEPGAG